jgi:hypothetical protein
MKTFNEILKAFVNVMAIASWVGLFIVISWKIALCLLFILWAENLRK